MEKKGLKIAALLAALVMIAGLGYFANELLGNPISKALAINVVKKRLGTTYADTDYYMEDIRYSFKDGYYHAFIKSPSSIDTEFTLMITKMGELRLDTYDDIRKGFRTAERLGQEYRQLTDTVFDSPTFPYVSDTGRAGAGLLEIYTEEEMNDPEATYVPNYAISYEELIIDKIYDIKEVGKEAGCLNLHIVSEEVTAERAAEMMLDIRRIFDEADIPFRAMNFTLQYPMSKDGERKEGEICVRNFNYGDIVEEGMEDRVVEAHRALEEYYKELDTKGTK